MGPLTKVLEGIADHSAGIHSSKPNRKLDSGAWGRAAMRNANGPSLFFLSYTFAGLLSQGGQVGQMVKPGACRLANGCASEGSRVAGQVAS